MKKTECREFKNMLVGLRSRLRGDVTAMADAALKKTRSEANGDLSSMPIHIADIGSANYEQGFTLSRMPTDAGTLDSIELALAKIDDGWFGLCDACGAPSSEA